ncbi:hypothetical protein BC332_07361 [Capsicum chinense]|nr:hypothetical protein BC332_07361 [Capsicum chinense]
MDRILQRCGLGYNTYISKGLLKKPTDMSAEAAIEEVKRAVFGVINELLMKTGVQCENISILVTVCGVFNIMPSLSSVIVRRYNLRHEHRTYNITGMECTAGLLALGLVQNLLKIHGNSYILLVSTDSLTENVYKGNDRSKLLSNCIFRVAGPPFSSPTNRQIRIPPSMSSSAPSVLKPRTMIVPTTIFSWKKTSKDI